MKKSICVLLLLVVLCFAAWAVSEESQKVSPGDIITFGTYEQDNNLDNGPEPIEWIVLDVLDGKALLLSRYGLDSVQDNAELVEITWEECTLRAWLNNDFLNSAFSAEEKAAIPTIEVDNSDAQGYSEWDTAGGNNTRDQIFLLSSRETYKYLNVTYAGVRNMQSRVVPTDYAISAGAAASAKNKTEDGRAVGWWWLRSPGRSQRLVAIVDNNGSLDDVQANNRGGIVRPALWLDLESGIF